ncbi:MAG: bifunctional adenosylcobinamide kinase/adenosylcobinamide-phosphate guanylyltransferase [Treponema sp.]|nr:bifunctional adenosylcobinamide kinase/adenosylcobinamide-phosphate guanylyltransferase [Treponema sp.]
MIILISGGCKNGKSSFAQDLACKLAKKTQYPPIYFATMLPYDKEDKERIEKHREDRKNLGFLTVECGKDVATAIEKIRGRAVLFDSLTALTANEIFLGKVDFSDLIKKEKYLYQKVYTDLIALCDAADSVIFVSDGIYRDGNLYDSISELYRRILASLEKSIAKKSQLVYEMVAGKAKIIKKQSLEVQENGGNMNVIIGGAYQGKTVFAKKQFSISDSDIHNCQTDFPPDLSKKCLTHYENYVAYCIKNKLPVQTDFSGSQVKTIICDDIFCGIVPVDEFQRRLREEAGRALQKIANADSSLYRVFCGIGERIS